MSDFDFFVVVDCQYCGKSYDVNCRKEDYDNWKKGEGYIQDILDYLSASDRELLISSICDHCWKKMFGDDDEED